MIVAALCVVLSGVTFEKVDIPGVYVRYATPQLGHRLTNFRHADIDDDGHMDLLLPARVYLRPEGRFDPAQFISMPDVDSDTRVDIWDKTLFFRSESSLTAYEFVDGAWNQTLSIKHEWKLQELVRMEPDETRSLITFERFLHDVDGDGRPEILIVDDPGIAVSILEDNQLRTTHLDLFPEPRLLSNAGHNTLWPQSERRIAFPNRKAMFHVVIESGSVVVVERIRPKSGGVAFRVNRYRIEPDEGEGFTLSFESSHQTETMPSHIHFPFALNEDDTVDYFGYRYDRPTYTNWKPLLRGFASTDGGKTVKVETTRGFRGWALFVDLDGDGNKDWIAEESGLFSGGLRETANRALFQRKVTHTILAKMQNSDRTFESRWRTQGRFTIQLDEPPRNFTHRFLQYLLGNLVDCTGDFNGDKWKDALIGDSPETVSLHLGGPEGFNVRAEAQMDVPSNTIPVAVDVDGDGRSDLAMMKESSHTPVAIYLNVSGS